MRQVTDAASAEACDNAGQGKTLDGTSKAKATASDGEKELAELLADAPAHW